jgi:hypothetical protein
LKKLLITTLLTIVIYLLFGPIYGCKNSREIDPKEKWLKYFTDNITVKNWNSGSYEDGIELTITWGLTKHYYYYSAADDILSIQFDKRWVDSCYIIKYDKIMDQEKGKCFYIKWKFRKQEYRYFSDTTAIQTNLTNEMVRELYPSYRGKIIQKSFKNIIIDYKYDIFNRDFFKKIQFVE